MRQFRRAARHAIRGRQQHRAGRVDVAGRDRCAQQARQSLARSSQDQPRDSRMSAAVHAPLRPGAAPPLPRVAGNTKASSALRPSPHRTSHAACDRLVRSGLFWCQAASQCVERGQPHATGGPGPRRCASQLGKGIACRRWPVAIFCPQPAAAAPREPHTRHRTTAARACSPRISVSGALDCRHGCFGLPHRRKCHPISRSPWWPRRVRGRRRAASSSIPLSRDGRYGVHGSLHVRLRHGGRWQPPQQRNDVPLYPAAVAAFQITGFLGRAATHQRSARLSVSKVTMAEFGHRHGVTLGQFSAVGSAPLTTSPSTRWASSRASSGVHGAVPVHAPPPSLYARSSRLDFEDLPASPIAAPVPISDHQSSSYEAIFHWPPDVRHQLKLYSCGVDRPENEIADRSA
jgi:hypothetical protein